MTLHQKFIVTPLSTLLREASSTLGCLEASIGSMPLRDYFMQALFLRMTGFQEQKVKCICWELACDDYDYRYRKFAHGFDGECSTYGDKNDILNDLYHGILALDHDALNLKQVDRSDILLSAKMAVVDLKKMTDALGWFSKEYDGALKWHSSLKDDCLLKCPPMQPGQKKPKVELFASCKQCSRGNTQHDCLGRGESLETLYEDAVYRHRNRCAHNTTSYQSNLPKLMELYHEDGLRSNYIVRFLLLLMIDEMFIRLYKLYRSYQDGVS